MLNTTSIWFNLIVNNDFVDNLAKKSNKFMQTLNIF